IKNTKTDIQGTLITNDYRILRNRKDNRDKIITSVAQIDNRVQVSIETNQENNNNEILFDSMAKAGISIDMINIYPNQIYFIVDREDIDILDTVLEDLQYEYKLIDNCSKVTII